MIRVILFAIIFHSVISCSDRPKLENSLDWNAFESVRKELDINTLRDYSLIIIPVDGCSGCDKYVVEELLRNKNGLKNVNIQVILSGIHYQSVVQDYPLFGQIYKVALDRNNLMTRYGLVSLYPRIIKFSNSRPATDLMLDPTEKEAKFNVWLNEVQIIS